MPLTVFDCKGISATRREHIEAAVEAAGQDLAQPYEGWIAADNVSGGVGKRGAFVDMLGGGTPRGSALFAILHR